jgi:hypothetical protein
MNDDVERSLYGNAAAFGVSTIHRRRSNVEKTKYSVVERHHQLHCRSALKRMLPVAAHRL